ncbi:peptidylprolyl isomerase [Ruixingdingia sedimenti]|uniref:Parvulin-like PPIase n=1 Tax=Ruixingdingia sedimenti TaxID=3073604 RepID=A0ABU1F8C0_9RHOB|nr:peptidylprolyl isomerase [Xinfangfangia sp. LG-4]MDR5653106.1 peptidylprolyl isomerase [Xinfangfangia sp. LG-4]
MARQAGIGATLAVALAITAGTARAEGADRVLASVNGTDITLGHVAVMLDQLPAEYKALPDEVLFKGILDQLIQQTALAQSAEGKTNARDDVALENERRAYLSTVALRAAIDGAVTEDAIAAAYKERYAEAAPQTEYSAAHILVETEDEAKKLKADLDGGADFAELAKVHSKDPGSGAGGGDLGWFGLGMMIKPFEDAVVAMEPGQVSDPLQTQFGWHIIKLNETRLAAVPPLEDVREELAEGIEGAAVEALVADLTGAANIERKDEGIDPALMRDQTLFAN